MMKKRWKYEILSDMGFSGRVPPRMRKPLGNNNVIMQTSRNQYCYHANLLPPPRPSRGAPKARHTLAKSVLGFGSGQSQNVWFSLGNTTFFKYRQSAPGDPPGAFCTSFWDPRGGPGTPPGGRAVFQGGPGGPFGGPWAFRGGARGGPEAPVMTSAGYTLVFPSPKGL